MYSKLSSKLQPFYSIINVFNYFSNNLYNTNDNFDYGGFRALVEAQAQLATSTTLFAYRFLDPGVYVFYLSTDINQKMVSASRQQLLW